METFTALLKQIGQIFTWWVMVAPWEQALRVRAGKHVRRLQPGVHLRVPFLDTVYVQSVRLRVAHLSIQNVMTRDRKALTTAGAIGYAVADIEQLYQRLHHAQDTLANLAAMAIAATAAQMDADTLTPDSLAEAATARLHFEAYGLTDVSLRVTDFAFVRTYRLISDVRWGGYGDALNVEKAQG